MKTPLSWISLYTPLADLEAKKTPEELAHLYSIHTAEIDDIIPHTIDKVVVGKVLSTEKHPESKKLSIVQVDLGVHGTETILTWAENIAHAQYVAVALVGAVLGGDFVIGERKMAGMMSRGMICSDDELWLVDERAEGILILEEIWEVDLLASKIGTSFFDLELPFPGIGGATWKFPLRDTTFEIDNKFITNRPDLFSVIGNAREWHTVFDIAMQSVLPREDTPITVTPHSIHAHIETPRCLAYSLLEMRDISVAPSPLGMRVMMHRAGLGPKYDLVDITNLMMAEYGQPMHVFDADKVTGDIRVRLAREGETILALNGIEYTLTAEDMVIADDNGPIAIAGVMGGMESAISETSTHIIWESATFDATSVRLTAQRLALRTDASTRYEKSLDPTLAGKTFPRVLEYLDFCQKSYTIVGQFHHLDTIAIKKTTITVPVSLISQKAWVPVTWEQILPIIDRLGFVVTRSSQESITVEVPSWRATKDITIPEDIAEEVLRVIGYDHFPLKPLSGDITLQEKNEEKIFRDRVLTFFSGRGWHEVYNYSFTNAGLEKKSLSQITDQHIAIANAYTEDFTHLRSSMAPHLIANISDNVKYRDALAFFEIGKVYTKQLRPSKKIAAFTAWLDNHPYAERKKIAGTSTKHSLLTLRQDLEMFLSDILGYVPPLYQGTQSLTSVLHPGIMGSYRIDATEVVTFGQIHPSVAENFEAPEQTMYFEIDFEILLDFMLQEERLFQPISSYQSIPRELNFILPEHTETGKIARDIEALHPWISHVVVDSVYRDPTKVGEGKKSVNFSFSLQSMDKTISDHEAGDIQNTIITSMKDAGYSLRGL